MTSSTVRRELILVSAAHSGCGGDSAPLPAPGAGGRAMKFDEFFQRINNVTLKLTAGCNLHCTYCNAEAETPKTPRMSMERFKQTARLLVANSRSPFVGMEFHGGEPLLLPDEWFEEAVAYGRALGEQHHKRVNFAFVTNGTLLTEERLVRLNKLSVHFCMSADGPPEINDSVRGGGHAVERALLLFRRLRIRHSVLTVMSRGNFRRMTQVLDWFKDIGVSDVRVNFVEPQGRGNDEAQLLSGEEMFEGMRQVLDHLDRTGVSVREAEMLMAVDRFLYGRDAKPQLSCWEVQCQAGRSYVAVDHEGVVHPCGSDAAQPSDGPDRRGPGPGALRRRPAAPARQGRLGDPLLRLQRQENLPAQLPDLRLQLQKLSGIRVSLYQADVSAPVRPPRPGPAHRRRVAGAATRMVGWCGDDLTANGRAGRRGPSGPGSARRCFEESQTRRRGGRPPAGSFPKETRAMAILRSVDGQFYEIPDDQLSRFLVPEDKVKEKLQEAGGPGPGGGPPPGMGGGGAPVVIQVFGGGARVVRGGGPGGPQGRRQQSAEVSAYSGCGGPPWHNCWHNCWRNCS